MHALVAAVLGAALISWRAAAQTTSSESIHCIRTKRGRVRRMVPSAQSICPAVLKVLD
jgi:hypothetical protein